MKYLKLFVVVSIIGLFGILINGCDHEAGDPDNVVKKSEYTIIEENIIDYGNYVYYFNYAGADFGNAVSDFREKHPELELITSTSDNTDGYGSTVGYFVFFKKKDR